MTIHLDTGFLIRALKAGSPEDRKLRGWVETGEMLVMSGAPGATTNEADFRRFRDAGLEIA